MCRPTTPHPLPVQATWVEAQDSVDTLEMLRLSSLKRRSLVEDFRRWSTGPLTRFRPSRSSRHVLSRHNSHNLLWEACSLVSNSRSVRCSNRVHRPHRGHPINGSRLLKLLRLRLKRLPTEDNRPSSSLKHRLSSRNMRPRWEARRSRLSI